MTDSYETGMGAQYARQLKQYPLRLDDAILPASGCFC